MFCALKEGYEQGHVEVNYKIDFKVAVISMDFKDFFSNRFQSAEEYLARRYEVPEIMQALPLDDEDFMADWLTCKPETSGLDFLKECFSLPTDRFAWRKKESISLTITESLGGRLPVIGTADHEDFCCMMALLNGWEAPREYPVTVNAFTMQAGAKEIYHHRLLLLNSAPYSNIPAEKLGLGTEEWLERSHRLRLRHECVHYETLRLFGDMKNHALDEIAADALGQIAAFGSFDADRQRLFFGLEKGKDICTGRLSFYCKKIDPEERGKVYRAVDEALDGIALELNELSASGKSQFQMIAALLGKSIGERLS